MKFSSKFIFAILVLLSMLLIFSSCESNKNNQSQNPNNNDFPKNSEKSINFKSAAKSCTIIEIAKNDVPNSFYPFGGYVVYGEKPEGLKDFDNFTIDKPIFSEEFSQNSAQPDIFRVNGALVTRNFEKENVESRNYEIKELKISPQSIYFSTKEVADIYFELDGKFVRDGNLVRFNEKDVIVLEGKIRKFQQNKLVIEANLKFGFKVWKAEFPVENCPK